MTETTYIHFTPIEIMPSYGISEAGEVMNLNKKRILKPTPNSQGYLLFNAGSKLKLTVHQEVARIYVPNPNNNPVVNHKDGNKRNNHYSNLEWVTQSENSQHAYDIGLHTPPWIGKFGKDHVTSKPIIQYDLNGNKIREWECARQAQREVGFHNGRICDVCKGKYKSHKGFVFKYK